ncbi:MAG TPA: FkbM family methyltransferase, partial [Candidatus Dojkabacteria bacterium]|nr:FkbM family methyltransferase [Candidatus Dojkabacteria bacterium]
MEQDPIVSKRIGKKNLYLRESHQLPLYLKLYPFYDRALARIAKDINEIDGYLTMIDIGANIGDSVALVTDTVQGQFLCIEGDHNYLPLLKRNIKKFTNSKVFVEESFCSDKDNMESQFAISSENGTSKLIENDNDDVKVSFKKLDTIVKSHKGFDKTNLLKIDTDGFEINILKGALSFL